MSGKRYFLDTNAIISILKGDSTLLSLLHEADYIATSIICELEFLSFPALSEQDAHLFKQLLSQIEVIDLTSNNPLFKQHIIQIRSTKKIKLPDAIIVATAIQTNCLLLTNDQQLLALPEIETRSF
jgi:predicted nucleic acid-binding protein